MDVGRGIDALGVFLTGGAGNGDPDLSLGGAKSNSRMKDMHPLISYPIPAIRIDDLWGSYDLDPDTLRVQDGTDLVFDPASGGGEGAAVAVAAGETKVISSSNKNRAVRVYREPGMIFSDFVGNEGKMEMYPAFTYKGAVSQKNVTDAQRVAGVTTYRGIILKAIGLFGVTNIELWQPPQSSQATFTMGTEATVVDAIQTIPNEETAPAAVSFASYPSEGSALWIGTLSPGASIGIWLKRVFPSAAAGATGEAAALAIKYRGA